MDGMTSSTVDTPTPLARVVEITDEMLTVGLTDGRTISVPLAWYPRLSHGSDAEKNNWRFIGGGRGLHWPDLDEDISIQNLLAGNRSGESQQSFQKWLESRRQQT
jgi:hypothetical protein